MRSPRGSTFSLAAMVFLAACGNEPTTAFAPDAEELSSDLTLTIPAEIPDRRVTIERFGMEDDPGRAGPARTEDEGTGTYYDFGTRVPDDARAGIFDPRTEAWFLTGRLSVVGRHDYVGNKSSVDTRANLSFQGTVVGSDQSYAEKAYPFLWAPWDVHSIWTEARIYTDKECGYDAWGDSLHKAWWEAVFGGPVFNFSLVSATSTSDRIFQPACPPGPSSPGGTMNGGGNTSGGGEAICYLWITYDLYSGDIYDQQVIFCTDGG